LLAYLRASVLAYPSTVDIYLLTYFLTYLLSYYYKTHYNYIYNYKQQKQQEEEQEQVQPQHYDGTKSKQETIKSIKQANKQTNNNNERMNQ
jgi:ATPase subunit of ABC transporter with duplicated ATPase domains